mmetsp:Transcript_6105/g.11148  ORF Transcript_6105/g.11148 Transcript_6105/m.11148 type:complete len:230 (-) Transcript_6105:848-1537(-)
MTFWPMPSSTTCTCTTVDGSCARSSKLSSITGCSLRMCSREWPCWDRSFTCTRTLGLRSLFTLSPRQRMTRMTKEFGHFPRPKTLSTERRHSPFASALVKPLMLNRPSFSAKLIVTPLKSKALKSTHEQYLGFDVILPGFRCSEKNDGKGDHSHAPNSARPKRFSMVIDMRNENHSHTRNQGMLSANCFGGLPNLTFSAATLRCRVDQSFIQGCTCTASKTRGYRFIAV